MLALIFTFLSFFSSHGSPASHGVHNLADTVKKKQNVTQYPDSVSHFLIVNRIFITGNQITRDRIILRELSLRPGDVVYSSDLVGIFDLDRKKLINTRLFNTVEIRMLELGTGRIDILVDLNERWYTFPAPVMELADRNFNEWWQNYNHDIRRINYGLRLYQYNMRGRNETLRFHAQFGFQRKLELMYKFPYIDKKQKHGLSIDLGFQETKNLAYATESHKYVYLKSDKILRVNRLAGLTYTYRNSFYQTHNFELKYYGASVNDTVKILNPNYIQGEARKLSYSVATYTFNSDHRDFIAYPLKGHQLTLWASQTGLWRSDDVYKTEASISYSKYLDLGKNYYLSNNAVGYWSTPSNVSYINYGVLGLKRQFVRGYEIYVIEGPYFALNKTTLKKLLFSRKYHWKAMPIQQFRHIPLSVYLKTYTDLGYVKNYPYYENRDYNTRLSDKLLAGAGFGLDVIGSYDVVVRFEYTFNSEGENGFFFHVKREF